MIEASFIFCVSIIGLIVLICGIDRLRDTIRRHRANREHDAILRGDNRKFKEVV